MRILALILASALVLAACGKKAPLRPPAADLPAPAAAEAR